MEQAISFKCDGQQIIGILHRPDGPSGERPNLGLVLAHSGSRGRLGNTFHYPFMARQLARLGYPVLRCDPPGLGDSSGTIATGPTRSFYREIQEGRFVGDTLAAIKELRRLTSPRHVVLIGICGGAITALEAAALAEGVSGAALLSIPVTLDFARTEAPGVIPPEYARKYLRSLYASKIFSPRAWLRLVTLRSDVSLIRSYVAAILRGLMPAPAQPGARKTGASRFNPRFLESLQKMMQGKRRVVFIFGEDDRFRWDFEREFYDIYWHTDAAHAKYCSIHKIPHCNHMLTMREWQQQAVQLIADWLPSVVR